MKKLKIAKKLLHFGCLVYLTFYDEENSKYIAVSEGFNKTKLRLKMSNDIKKEGSLNRGLF